jgi:hypothetical protein
MEVPGKQFRKLEEADIPALQIFCDECKALGYVNNESFTAIKLDKMVMPYGQFLIGIEDGKIFTIAGVHRLPEVNKHAWRCLFRGAQLPGYTPAWSLDIFKSGIHFSQFLCMQIKLVQELDSNAEFYISTNVKSDTGAKSSRMNDVMMPRIAKRGIWNLELENFMLYNVPQNLWKVNVANYMEARERWLSDESYTD